MRTSAVAAWSALRNKSGGAFPDEALRNSEEKLRMLLDGVHDQAIFMVDPAGKIGSWNSGAERITGYTAKEIVGESYARFFAQDDVEAAIR